MNGTNFVPTVTSFITGFLFCSQQCRNSYTRHCRILNLYPAVPESTDTRLMTDQQRNIEPSPKLSGHLVSKRRGFWNSPGPISSGLCRFSSFLQSSFLCAFFTGKAINFHLWKTSLFSAIYFCQE